MTMLDRMRRHKGWLKWSLALVVLTFVIFYIPDFLTARTGGAAPGVDRIVMLLADEPNIREIVAFPMNQQAMDLLMQAPNGVDPSRLKELHIRLDLPPERRKG